MGLTKAKPWFHIPYTRIKNTYDSEGLFVGSHCEEVYCDLSKPDDVDGSPANLTGAALAALTNAIITLTERIHMLEFAQAQRQKNTSGK